MINFLAQLADMFLTNHRRNAMEFHEDYSDFNVVIWKLGAQYYFRVARKPEIPLIKPYWEA